ncbi:MAG: response regulator transcription factor [Chloroflexi bacterium]|nr:MAG: response regulator transcription factor [Chloroflexota bacterium]
MRMINELRDPWAIAFAQATAVLTYFLFAAPLWQSLVAAAAVLGARVAAGLTLPFPATTIPPPSLLTEAELAVARYVAMGRTDEEIAQRTQSSEKIVRKRRQTVMTKLGFEREWELREWALAHRLIPEPPARHWYERTLVRGTLAGGGLIGLCWTTYQILRVLLPLYVH